MLILLFSAAIIICFLISLFTLKNRYDFFDGWCFISCLLLLGGSLICSIVPVDTKQETYKVLEKHKFESGQMVFYLKDDFVKKNDSYWYINFDKIDEIVVTYNLNSFGGVLLNPQKTYSIKEK